MSDEDDKLFAISVQEQRVYVARCLRVKEAPMEWWQVVAIDILLSVRRNEGKETFYREIGRMLSPDEAD